jgi:hypothetical protein
MAALEEQLVQLESMAAMEETEIQIHQMTQEAVLAAAGVEVETS